MRLVDNRADAEELSQRGWLRLFAIKFRRELTNQAAHLPGLEKWSVLLARLVSPAALREQLRDLIARIAFIDDQPTLRDVVDFEARTLDAVRRISIATQEVAPWLPNLAQQYHAIRLAIESAPGPWQEVADDIAEQLADLTSEQFLSRVAWSDLKEYPRYFQAAKLRWDKLRSGGVPKDRKLREAIARLWLRYQELSASPSAAEHRKTLHEARMLIEELRVSTFAQQLGTRQSVSAKRIDEILARIS
jgi:ATP-dependent helicase HrpA